MGKNIYDQPSFNSSNYDRPSETLSNIYDKIGIPNAASTFGESESIGVSSFTDFQKPYLVHHEAKKKKSFLKFVNNRKFIVALVVSIVLALIVIGLVVFLVIYLNGKFSSKQLFH